MTDDVIFDKNGVAENYNLPKSNVSYLVSTGQIPFSRIGKRTVRFSKKELDKWFYQERKNVPIKYNTKS
jgi:excisionase family DNA binding protein